MKFDKKEIIEGGQITSIEVYRSILSLLNIGIWKWNLATDEIIFDKVLLDLLDCSPNASNKYNSQKFLECTHFDDVFFRDFLNTKDHNTFSSSNTEHRLLRENGSYIWVLSTWNVEVDEENKPQYIIGSVRDVSARKNQEILSAKYKNLLDRTNEAATIGTWEVNLEAQEVVWSNITKRIHETPRDYVPCFENAVAFYKPGKHRENLIRLFQNCVANGESFDDEFIIITAKNNEKWVRAIGISEMENGKCVRVYGVIQDIDEKAQLINKLETTEQVFRKTFDFAGIGMALVGMDFSWLRVNQSLCEIFGYSKEEFLNLKYPDFAHPEDRDDDAHLLREVMKGKLETFQVERRYIHKDGSVVWTILTISMVRDDKEKPLHFVFQFSDISSRISAEKKVQELLEITKDQNLRLLNFAHIVSHNLRSHSGNLEMLLNLMEMDNPEAIENDIFPLLRTAVENLEETVQHLNEVAILNAKTGQNLSSLNLFDYLKKAIVSIKALSLENKATIINNINESLNVKAIPAYLDSIMLNFLTNAIKYRSPERAVFVVVEASVDDDNVIISFKDNGLGIDLKTHGDKLFGLYKTFHEAKDSRGLGLFITKNQIEAIGGRVWVESTVNEGTTFFVSLKNNEN